MRPLNKKELTAGLESAIASHYLIRRIDDLKDTNMYRHSLKAAANNFLKELERYAKDMVWEEEVENSDKSEAANQIEVLSDALHENISKLLEETVNMI